MRCTLLIACLMCLLTTVASAQVKLGAAQLPTFIDEEQKPARINAIMHAAFAQIDEPLTLSVMRPAFLGSGILSGRLDGHYAFIDLDTLKDTFVYSQPYLPLYLYSVSKRDDVVSVTALPHLQDRRVAIDNLFANTDEVRLLKGVKWARNPSSYDAFRQLADNRAYYLMSSRLLVDEFNRLLRDEDEELLHFSGVPLISAGFRIAMPASDTNRALLARFDEAIASMQGDGSYNQLLGVAWLTKDLNGDGVADYISSVNVAHPKLEKGALSLAYPLDSTLTSDQSQFVIDGTTYDSWDAALAELQRNGASLRPSMLDKEVYQRILDRW